jgi:putative PIN family toxin of toxin-antitoxin system
MNIVIDTNIFISGLFFPSSNPGKIIKLWRDEKCSLFLSEPLITEISKVLSYPKIRKRLKWDNERIESYCFLLRLNCRLVDIKDIKAEVPKDRKDNHVLAAFLASKSDFLISGDSDLLELKDQYQIISPKEFIEKFS